MERSREIVSKDVMKATFVHVCNCILGRFSLKILHAYTNNNNNDDNKKAAHKNLLFLYVFIICINFIICIIHNLYPLHIFPFSNHNVTIFSDNVHRKPTFGRIATTRHETDTFYNLYTNEQNL